MAVTPDNILGSVSVLKGSGSDVILDPYTVQLTVSVGSTTPLTITEDYNTAHEDALFLAPNQAVDFWYDFSTYSSGLLGSNAVLGIGFFIVKDDDDTSGTGANIVYFRLLQPETTDWTLPAGGVLVSQETGTGQIPSTVFDEAGSYRIVAVMWETDSGTEATGEPGTPPNTGDVGSGLGNSNFYVDADGNEEYAGGGASDPTIENIDTKRVGWSRIGSQITSVAKTGVAPYSYPDTFTLSCQFGTAVHSPKNLRLVVEDNSVLSASADPHLSETAAVSGGGAASITVEVDDRLTGAPSNLWDSRVHIGPVGGSFGGPTPANEQPDLFTGRTVTLVNTNDRSWVTFLDHATYQQLYAGLLPFAVGDRIPFQASGSLLVFKDAALTDPGIETHWDAGRTILNRVFRRTQGSSTEGAIVYYRFYLADPFNNPIVSDITVDVVRPSNDSTEDSQPKTSAADGLVTGNYTVVSTDPAFNRLVRNGITRQAGSHIPTGGDNPALPPLSVPLADVANGNPLGVVTATGPFPCYPRDVLVTGDNFGVNEPEVETEDVFGVSSEAFIRGMWTGDLSQAVEDANDAPIGVGRRTKNLGTGALRTKVSSEYSESTSGLVDASRFLLRDVCGRQISTSSQLWQGRRGAWNITIEAVHEALNDLTNPKRLQGNLGYPTQFNQTDAPTDPSVVRIMVGYAPNSTQRSAFNFTDESDYGFDLDTHMFALAVQDVQFIVVDPDLVIPVSVNEIRVPFGQTVTIQAALERLLPGPPLGVTSDDAGIVPTKKVQLIPDEKPTIWILRAPEGGGSPFVVVLEDLMTPIPPLTGDLSDNWEYEYTPVTKGSYTAMITAVQNGSRAPDMGEVRFSFGVRDPLVKTQILQFNLSDFERPWAPGDSIIFIQQLIHPDEDPPNLATTTFNIARIVPPGLVEWLESDGVTWTLTEPASDNFSADSITDASATNTFADTTTWTPADYFLVSNLEDEFGVPYTLIHEWTAQLNTDIKLYVDMLNDGKLQDHLSPGDTLTVHISAFHADGQPITLDTSPVPECALLRSTPAGDFEYLDSDGVTWVNLPASGPTFYHPLSLSGDVWSLDTVIDTSWGERDLIVVGRGRVNGMLYTNQLFREVTGILNKHSKNAFDPTGLFK